MTAALPEPLPTLYIGLPVNNRKEVIQCLIVSMPRSARVAWVLASAKVRAA